MTRKQRRLVLPGSGLGVLGLAAGLVTITDALKKQGQETDGGYGLAGATKGAAK